MERLHRSLTGSAISGIRRRCRNGFHHDTSPVCRFYRLYSTKLVSRLIGPT
ncbi:MAG: hypothetical protein ACI9HH_004963 [Pseudomonadota bacterium]